MPAKLKSLLFLGGEVKKASEILCRLESIGEVPLTVTPLLISSQGRRVEYRKVDMQDFHEVDYSEVGLT